MVMLPVLFLMVNNYFHDAKWFAILTVLLLVGGALGLMNEFVVGTIPVQNRGTFTMWVMGLSVALVLFKRDLPLLVRIGLVGLAAGWAYWSFGLRITWLASWLPAGVAIGILTFMRSRKLFFVVLVAIAIWAVANRSFIDKTFADEDTESGQTRMAAWVQNWGVTREHLLLGTGPAGYAAYYMTYFPTNAMATHNNYIDVIAETGIIGMLFYLWFFVALAWIGFRLCLRVRGRGDFVEALANAAFAGAIGCIIINAFGDWLIPFAYTQTIAGFDYAAYNWLFLAAIPVLERLTRPEPTQEVVIA
jgi:O-antigen ligase